MIVFYYKTFRMIFNSIQLNLSCVGAVQQWLCSVLFNGNAHGDIGNVEGSRLPQLLLSKYHTVPSNLYNFKYSVR
jgi:hypothetical protein